MRILTRIGVFFLMIYLMAFGVFAQANTPTIVVSKGTAAAGDQVSITVSLQNNPGIASMKLSLEYDTEYLSLKSVVDAGKLGAQFHKPEYVSPYILTWANDTVTENYTYNGAIVTLVFEISDDAPLEELPIVLSYNYENYDIIDWKMNKVEFATVNGAVVVGNPEPTDLEQFEYTLNSKNSELTIDAYLGDDAKVIIAESYVIDGKEYTVVAIGEEAFAENETLESVTLPGTVVEIGEGAFLACVELREVKLSDGLKIIGVSAFEACEALKEVVIPKSVEIVDEYAFYDCLSMQKAVVLGVETEVYDRALGFYYISRREDGVVEGFQIRGFEDSLAQEYADTEGIPFKGVLGFSAASITLHSSLTINFKADKALFEEYGFHSPTVTVKANGKDVVISQYNISGNQYVFSFRNVAPNQIGDNVTAVLEANFGAETCSSDPANYSIAQYCYNMLSATEDTQLRTLLVDLLNYGAASQVYTEYKTDSLANASLTSMQKQWGTNTEPTKTNYLNIRYKTVENPTAVWKGASLVLRDSVAMRFILSTDDITNKWVKIQSGDQMWSVSSDNFKKENGNYTVLFAGLDASQMRQPVYLTVYDGGKPVSNTVCYSVSSYAYDKWDSTISGLSELVVAMMKYGDSAYAYASR